MMLWAYQKPTPDWGKMSDEERYVRYGEILRGYPNGHNQIEKIKKQMGKYEKDAD